MVGVITAWGVRWTGLPHSPKTDSDHLMKDNRHAVITLTIHYDQQLHAAIIQYIPHTYMMLILTK